MVMIKLVALLTDLFSQLRDKHLFYTPSPSVNLICWQHSPKLNETESHTFSFLTQRLWCFVHNAQISRSCRVTTVHIDMTSNYCKRCYFRGINISRLAAQKHIRGLLNSRWADAHLSFSYCTKLTSFNEWYIYKYVCNWAAQKQSRSQTDSSIIFFIFLLPICINTHGQ